LGNFVLVNDIRKQIDPQVLRFFMLSVHYRHPINFSQELVENAQNGLARIRTSYANLAHRLEASPELGDYKDIWLNKIEEVRNQFKTAMDDDFNTANGIAALFELASLANMYLIEKHTEAYVLTAFMDTLKELALVLGIEVEVQSEVLDEEIDALIEARIQARKDRDFARADAIRDQLKEMNIILEDTAQGIRWKRG
ncbi:MAG TPA: DALR domain-containing protein, partial [Paenisporosarcina sp.]|nr:DALR domain-containing protein [Paenisporosarcina sp.]